MNGHTLCNDNDVAPTPDDLLAQVRRAVSENVGEEAGFELWVGKGDDVVLMSSRSHEEYNKDIAKARETSEKRYAKHKETALKAIAELRKPPFGTSSLQWLVIILIYTGFNLALGLDLMSADDNAFAVIHLAMTGVGINQAASWALFTRRHKVR